MHSNISWLAFKSSVFIINKNNLCQTPPPALVIPKMVWVIPNHTCASSTALPRVYKKLQ